MEEKTNRELTLELNRLKAHLETLSSRFDAQSKNLAKLAKELEVIKALEFSNRASLMEEK